MILLLAILLVVFVPVAEPWGAVVIIAGCLLEIGEVAVLRRWSHHLDRRLKPATGAEAMIGRTAKVVAPCRPTRSKGFRSSSRPPAAGRSARADLALHHRPSRADATSTRVPTPCRAAECGDPMDVPRA